MVSYDDKFESLIIKNNPKIMVSFNLLRLLDLPVFNLDYNYFLDSFAAKVPVERPSPSWPSDFEETLQMGSDRRKSLRLC